MKCNLRFCVHHRRCVELEGVHDEKTDSQLSISTHSYHVNLPLAIIKFL